MASTGKEASATTVEKPWADAWLFGIIAPETIDTEEDCPNGVAQVQTQFTFLNRLVGYGTFGIYAPMSISATCAE